MKLSVCAFILVFLNVRVNSARILGIVPTPSYSHQIFLQPIWRELSLRGHQLTVLTTDPINDSTLTNLTEIDISSMYDLTKPMKTANFVTSNTIAIALQYLELFHKISELFFSHPKVEALINNKSEHFDLVMIEALFPAMYTFSERFGCPFITVMTLESPSFNYAVLGNPNHPVLYPDPMLPTSNLNFWERLASVLVITFNSIVLDCVVFPREQALVDRHFGNQYPRLREIESKMSMMFTNTDLVFHPRRPLLPNVVRIGGGMHINPPKPLPKKLKEILDEAKQGAIYFSLGSNVKSKDLPIDTQQIFLDAFAELPYLVLWKFELDGRETPKNVITSKWYPQQDIFGHPNVRLFITQGGLQSMEEAVHNFMPMIGIPFLGDQARNMKVMEEKGMGIFLEFGKLNKESLKMAILEVIENPRYRNQAEKLAKLVRDEPMTGLEKAVWWTEYVIRHKGATHFKRNEIPLYQYYLIDVIGFCLVVVFLVIFVFIKSVKLFVKIVKYFFAKRKAKTQ